METDIIKIEAAVLDSIREMLEELGIDEDAPLSRDSQLIADLGFASVDFIHLIVVIEGRFSQKFGFYELIMPNGKYVGDLRVGEIVDFSCYLQLGKHGEKHRACGQKCVNNGQPIGLLTKDGALYMLMPEEHDPRRDGGVDAKASAADHMRHIVTVNGTAARVNGYSAIFVQGLTK